jgi:hypothetical protein
LPLPLASLVLEPSLELLFPRPIRTTVDQGAGHEEQARPDVGIARIVFVKLSDQARARQQSMASEACGPVADAVASNTRLLNLSASEIGNDDGVRAQDKKFTDARPMLDGQNFEGEQAGQSKNDYPLSP